MKSILSAFLITTILTEPVFAEAFEFASEIEAVTVFPQGAEVTRVASGAVETGDHVIIVDDLPGGIGVDSIRVEGVGNKPIIIGSVDVKTMLVKGEDISQKRSELNDQLDGLNDRDASLKQILEDLSLQRSILKNIAGRASIPTTGANGINPISAGELDGLLGTTSKHLMEISKLSNQAKVDRRIVKREMNELKKELSQLAPRDLKKTRVEINFTATAETQAKFNIRYSVDSAGWQPVYDAKLSLKNKSVDADLQIIRKANVHQVTSESWDNVKLTLSTARKSSRMVAPNVNSNEIDIKARLLRAKRIKSLDSTASSVESVSELVSLDDKENLQGAAPAPVEMSFAGFQAEYSIAGLTKIRNVNQTKSVTIGVDTLPVTLSAKMAPRFDPTAYLIANMKVGGKESYLPGPVILQLDGAMIGKSMIPLLTPGEDFELGFGRDDLIRVEHSEIERKKGEQGFISSVNFEERAYVAEVSYHHDFPMNVEIVDSIPVSNHEDIVVKMLKGSAKPTEENVDEKRGVLAWNKEMSPGEAHKLSYGYSVQWPEGMQITNVN